MASTQQEKTVETNGVLRLEHPGQTRTNSSIHDEKDEYPGLFRTAIVVFGVAISLFCVCQATTSRL